MKNSEIINLAKTFVEHLLTEQLPGDRIFHNLQHTLNVVAAVQGICDYLKISEVEKEVLLLAAWFHDTGHTATYMGHENRSRKIAEEFFNAIGYNSNRQLKVFIIIEATVMPQRPHNLLEQIICDADLFHLSLPNYCQMQDLLRKELELNFNKQYTDKEWQRKNIEFLKNHEYFTPYGKKFLSPLKQENILKCEQRLQSLQALN